MKHWREKVLTPVDTKTQHTTHAVKVSGLENVEDLIHSEADGVEVLFEVLTATESLNTRNDSTHHSTWRGDHVWEWSWDLVQDVCERWKTKFKSEWEWEWEWDDVKGCWREEGKGKRIEVYHYTYFEWRYVDCKRCSSVESTSSGCGWFERPFDKCRSTSSTRQVSRLCKKKLEKLEKISRLTTEGPFPGLPLGLGALGQFLTPVAHATQSARMACNSAKSLQAICSALSELMSSAQMLVMVLTRAWIPE